MCLQHGVPLKLLVEKFAHTRFEPSGWTGNEEIGYAKSIMDYLFRWMQLRFLSGHQLSLFNLKSLGASAAAPALSFRSEAEESASAPALELGSQSIPVTGTVNAPDNTVIPSTAALQPTSLADPLSRIPDPLQFNDRRAPQQGIAPDLAARSGTEAPNSLAPDSLTLPPDRSFIHAADAMKSMYEMGDAPSCMTCGAIMTRNGSCYRCMECGSTSGCS